MSTPNWIKLQGAVNVRDVGGLPTADGQVIADGVLIRSANLQHLTTDDVTRLLGELDVRRVVDLRTDIEVAREAPGPLHAESDVVIHHLSLYPDDRGGEVEPSGPDPLLPWQSERIASTRTPQIASYLRYFERRPDSIVAALRAIAEPDGATVVHCAAGKDRTGVIVALALTVAGVPRDVIAADYAHTQSQIRAILDHLARSTMYRTEVTNPDDIPPASAEVMTQVLDAIDADFGGVLPWLATQGWTDADTQRLRRKLVAPAASASSAEQ